MRLLLSILISIQFCLASFGALAQGDLQQELERCDAIERAIEKLDCFEALTERGRTPGQGNPQTTGSPPTQNDAAAVADDPAGAPPAEGPSLSITLQSSETSTANSTGSAANEPALTAQQPDRAPAQPSAEPEVRSAPTPSRGSVAAEFGREQLPEEADAAGGVPDSITAMVSEVTEGVRGNLYFHLDNGQVWRQIEARFVPYPRNEPFEVQINQGMLGEYRLRVGGEGRLVRIRRVE